MKSKLKTYWLCLGVGSLCLTGCDVTDALNNVRREFPDSDIVTVPGMSKTFIVRNSTNEIWYVHNLGITTNTKNNKCLLLRPPQLSSPTTQ